MEIAPLQMVNKAITRTILRIVKTLLQNFDIRKITSFTNAYNYYNILA